MLEESANILKYRPGDKSLEVLFMIYADLECLLKMEQSSQNNPKNSYTDRKVIPKPSNYSFSLNCSFDEAKNRYKFYIRKDRIGRFCRDLKELPTEMINYVQKEMILLRGNGIKSQEKQKCHISKEGFVMIKIRKRNLNFITESEIIVITLEHLEELLIIFAI